MAGYLIGGRLVTSGELDAGEVTLRAVLPSNARIELPMNDRGRIDVDVKIPLVDPVTGASVDLPNELIPGRDFIGWVEGDTIVEAGPVWADPFSFPHTSQIKAEGLWSYFDYRRVLPVLTTGQLPRDVTSSWTGLSLRTIVKRLVEQACSWPSAALPITYETDVAGIHEREYPGSDLTVISQALSNLTEVEGGPDVAFRPRWEDATRRRVVWDLLTGNPELTQGGADHYWDVSVVEPHATIPGLDRNGRELATHMYVTGSTVDDVQLQAKASSTVLTAAGFPMLEATQSRNSVLLASTLQAYADEGVVRGSAHVETFKLIAKRDLHPKLGTYWPGDYARIRIGENARTPADTYRVRIVRLTFAAEGDVIIDCAPERVGSGYPVPSSDRTWLADQLRRLQASIDETNRG